MATFKVPIDCVQVSLSLDRSVLSSISSQNLELFLMNSLLNQCMGTLSFNSVNPNTQSTIIETKNNAESGCSPNPSTFSYDHTDLARPAKRKCNPGQKVLPRKEQAPMTSHAPTDSLCPTITNIISYDEMNNPSKLMSATGSSDSGNVMDLSPDSTNIANSQISNGRLKQPVNGSRVYFNHSQKVYPSTAPPLRVQVPSNDGHSKSAFNTSVTPPLCSSQNNEGFGIYTETNVDEQISSIGDEFRALFPPEEDDQENEYSLSSGDCQLHTLPGLESQDNGPVYIKTENFDDEQDDIRFLPSDSTDIPSAAADSITSSAYGSFSLADDDQPSCSSSGSNNDAIDNLAIIDQLFNNDDVTRDTVVVTPCKPPSDPKPTTIKPAPKLTAAAPYTVSVIASHSNKVPSIKIIGPASARQRIRPRVGGMVSRNSITPSKKRQNRVRINCSICSYNSDRGANVVRHYILVHKLPEPVAKLVVKGLRSTATIETIIDEKVSIPSKPPNIAPRLTSSVSDKGNCKIEAT